MANIIKPNSPETAESEKSAAESIKSARQALEAITTDAKEKAIMESTRARISGATELDELDKTADKLRIKVVTALRAAEKLIQDGKVRLRDPEISLDLIQGWRADLERNAPTKVYRIHTSLLDILRNIEVI